MNLEEIKVNEELKKFAEKYNWELEVWHDQNSVKRMAKRSRVEKLLERVEIELENKNPEEKQTL